MFQTKCLKAHNDYRAKHGVPPLKLSQQLCQISRQWAENLATRNSVSHSGNTNYGENIYCSWSSDPNHVISGIDPVDSW